MSRILCSIDKQTSFCCHPPVKSVALPPHNFKVWEGNFSHSFYKRTSRDHLLCPSSIPLSSSFTQPGWRNQWILQLGETNSSAYTGVAKQSGKIKLRYLSIASLENVFKGTVPGNLLQLGHNFSRTCCISRRGNSFKLEQGQFRLGIQVGFLQCRWRNTGTSSPDWW